MSQNVAYEYVVHISYICTLIKDEQVQVHIKLNLTIFHKPDLHIAYPMIRE